MELNPNILQSVHHLLANRLTVSGAEIKTAAICQDYIASLLQEIQKEVEKQEKKPVVTKKVVRKKPNGEKKAS